jgi:hypothetical protein
MIMYSHCMFMYDYPDCGFSVFFLSCKANARVKPAKTGHGPHSSYLLCCSIYLLCCSMYCLFCDVPCIACVYMCTEQLPPGGYPIAVKYIISYKNVATHATRAFGHIGVTIHLLRHLTCVNRIHLKVRHILFDERALRYSQMFLCSLRCGWSEYTSCKISPFNWPIVHPPWQTKEYKALVECNLQGKTESLEYRPVPVALGSPHSTQTARRTNSGFAVNNAPALLHGGLSCNTSAARWSTSGTGKIKF